MWMRSLRKRFVTFWCSMTALFSWLIHAAQRLRNSVDPEHGHVTRSLTVNFLFTWSWRSIKCTNLRKLFRLCFSSFIYLTDRLTNTRERVIYLNCMVGPDVHNYPEKLFTDNGAFQKRSLNRRIWKLWLSRFSLDWKDLKMELFETTTSRWSRD